MTVRTVIGAFAAVLLSVGGAAAQAPNLRSSVPVEAAAVDADPSAQAVRASYAACRPTSIQRLTVQLDRGPDAGSAGDLVALIDADCRRGPTQFLYIGLDAGQPNPDEVLLLLLPRPTYQGIAVDPATRRMFGRTPRGFEEIAWQRLTRDHLFRLRKPLREYAGLILPPVPAGPVPVLPAQAEAAQPAAPSPAPAPTATAPAAPAAPAPVADAARVRAELEAEIRAAIEPQLRQQLSAEVRQEIGAEVQARLDRARGIVEGLQRELEAERAAVARERAARETAERLLGLAQAAERDREARAVAEQALSEARATAERALAEARAAAERDLAEVRAQAARAEAEAQRLRSEAEARAAAAPAAPSTTTQQ